MRFAASWDRLERGEDFLFYVLVFTEKIRMKFKEGFYSDIEI